MRDIVNAGSFPLPAITAARFVVHIFLVKIPVGSSWFQVLHVVPRGEKNMFAELQQLANSINS